MNHSLRPRPAAIVARRFSPLALFRMARGITQSDVARRTGLDRRRVSDLDTGLRRPDDAEAARIAKALRAPRDVVSRLLARTQNWAKER